MAKLAETVAPTNRKTGCIAKGCERVVFGEFKKEMDAFGVCPLNLFWLEVS